MTFPQVALAGLVFGSTAAFGVMGAVAIRTVWAVTKGRRWYQFRQIAGLK